MPNPKAPRIRRSLTGQPLGPTSSYTPRFPAERIGRLGGDPAYWRAAVDALTAAERAEVLASWDVMTDDELAAEFTGQVMWVPTGTVREILTWVDAADGTDRAARARAALAAEETGARRTSLLAPLRSRADA